MDKPEFFKVHNGEKFSAPILISVPHAGRDYPPELLSDLRVPAVSLLRLEDRYADRLVQPAIAAGFPAIIAQRARAWIDLNRAENDIDAEMLTAPPTDLAKPPSAKTRGGLGLIPRRLQSVGDLWRGPIAYSEVERRIALHHRPYHRQVATILSAMRDQFGIAILLDVHSMPPLLPELARNRSADSQPQIIVGDRFGRSAASIHTELVQCLVRARGYAVALNHPYSGDHILRTHGDPRRDIHALQLEIDRSLYLDSELREPSGNLPIIANIVHEISMLLADNALGTKFAQAAE